MVVTQNSQWNSLEDCRRFAIELAAQIDRPLCIALEGTLGAGKTQWVRYFVEAMGGDADQVSSPTFVLMNQYTARLPILHLDLYRLNNDAELEGIGFDEIVYGQSVCLIEWADKFQNWLPLDRLTIQIQVVSDKQRIIRCHAAADTFAATLKF